MRHIDTLEKLTFNYDTGQIPPPFCHRYKIEIIKLDSKNPTIDLELEYYDRDVLSEEEIFDEGFTLEDNFYWQGHLPLIWGKEISEKLKSTNWRKKLLPSADGSEFIIKIISKDQTEILQPADSRTWENFCQEIIQAIFELSKKEAPLFITYVNKVSSQQLDQVDFEFSFSTRKIHVTTPKNKHQSIDWKDGQQLLKHIFSVDYFPEDGLEKIPKLPGSYISPGDGLWYEIGNKIDAGNASEKIKKLVTSLNSFCT